MILQTHSGHPVLWPSPAGTSSQRPTARRPCPVRTSQRPLHAPGGSSLLHPRPDGAPAAPGPPARTARHRTEPREVRSSRGGDDATQRRSERGRGRLLPAHTATASQQGRRDVRRPSPCSRTRRSAAGYAHRPATPAVKPRPSVGPVHGPGCWWCTRPAVRAAGIAGLRRHRVGPPSSPSLSGPRRQCAEHVFTSKGNGNRVPERCLRPTSATAALSVAATVRTGQRPGGLFPSPPPPPSS